MKNMVKIARIQRLPFTKFRPEKAGNGAFSRVIPEASRERAELS